MIESLKKTHADLHRAYRMRDVKKSAKVAERLDIPTILAACELATSFTLDTANDAGLTDEMVQEAADDLVNNANAHTERITVTLPVRKEVDSDD